MSKKTDWGKVVRDTVNDVICAIKNIIKIFLFINNFTYRFVFLIFEITMYINISTHKNRAIPLFMYSPINIPSIYPKFTTSNIFI